MRQVLYKILSPTVSIGVETIYEMIDTNPERHDATFFTELISEITDSIIFERWLENYKENIITTMTSKYDFNHEANSIETALNMTEEQLENLKPDMMIIFDGIVANLKLVQSNGTFSDITNKIFPDIFTKILTSDMSKLEQSFIMTRLFHAILEIQFEVRRRAIELLATEKMGHA